jgi:hypothetical protein
MNEYDSHVGSRELLEQIVQIIEQMQPSNSHIGQCAGRVQDRSALRVCFLVLVCILTSASVETLWSRQGPPPSPPPPHGPLGPPRLDAPSVAGHLQKVRSNLDEVKSRDADSEKLLSIARRSLDRADQKTQTKDFVGADRLISAADAFLHASEHPIHLVQGPKGPVPQPGDIADHLQRVYFRLQQADYFATASRETDAKALPALARKFYEQARKAYDSGSWFGADEYAKSADDTVRGLENLAQASVPEPPRPPEPK